MEYISKKVAAYGQFVLVSSYTNGSMAEYLLRTKVSDPNIRIRGFFNKSFNQFLSEPDPVFCYIRIRFFCQIRAGVLFFRTGSSPAFHAVRPLLQTGSKL